MRQQTEEDVTNTPLDNCSISWVVGLRTIVHLWDLACKRSALCLCVCGGGMVKGSYMVIKRVSEPRKISNVLCRQTQPRIEPGTSRLPDLSSGPLYYW